MEMIDGVGWRRVVAVTLRLLLALVFAVSSVAKFMAIDDFELYIYSYGFFSLNFSFVVARLCIAAEFILALLLATGWWLRWVRLAALLLLVAFSCFLCYALLAGRSDSCQCFGRMADLDPAQSLLKNAVLILMALGVKESKSQRVKKSKSVVAVVVGIAVVVAVFCVSVPDNWAFGDDEGAYNKTVLDASLSADGALYDYSHGHQLVAFVTPGCPYCRMTREKIGSMTRRHQLDTAYIHFVEPQDLPSGLFLDITYGQRPFVFLLDEGEVVVTYHYRNINEKRISSFLPVGK